MSKHSHVGVSIQSKETGKLALCAQLLFWLSISREKKPDAPYLALILKVPNLSALGAFSQDS